MTPYCICFYDGKSSKSFYLTDYKDSQEMLKFAISSLLKRKYKGYKIYVHNLSNFDGIFLLKILSSINHIKVQPILKDGKIINLKLNYDSINSYQINFRDSFLILPSSLRKLAIQFKVDNKTLFPYNFVNDKYNKNIDLNYIGSVPLIKYFINISLEDYNQYKLLFNKNWSLKDESIKYCNQDCISLYQIIHKFNILIYDKYHINIHKYPTLPSLAFGIYRTHYLKDYPIPLI
uniref:Probable DNA polymerase n=1 Tax=Rhizopogon vinicolor TaxID=80600 RepID=A0A4Y5SJR8_9AGAM|nr:DNA polymerase family B [Rhizopogon vinicolor]QDA23246.1 DNA polymerase family B [Rhizopogon vinicolor]